VTTPTEAEFWSKHKQIRKMLEEEDIIEPMRGDL
jgi:hypothetical protein